MAKSKEEFTVGSGTFSPKIPPCAAIIAAIASVLATQPRKRRPSSQSRLTLFWSPRPNQRGSARRIGLRVEGHDFQINRVSKLEQVIVGSHVGVALSKRDIEIKTVSNVQDALSQVRSNDGNMVELQHFPGPCAVVADCGLILCGLQCRLQDCQGIEG
jgi:hypothetical protein